MATASTLSQGEEAQLAQTIEMFEVITESQPQDYQSLEILKEAYFKLGREEDLVQTGPVKIDDGRAAMHKIFVEGKIIAAGDFDLCWITPDPSVPAGRVADPF